MKVTVKIASFKSNISHGESDKQGKPDIFSRVHRFKLHVSLHAS